MRPEDFHSFIRPMYLMAVLSGSSMLLSLPPNKRLAERARNFRPNLVAAIEQQNYHFAGICRYPSDEELLILRERRQWVPYVELIYRKRLQRVEARTSAENVRDCADPRLTLAGASA
jgi:hypothetical protein